MDNSTRRSMITLPLAAVLLLAAVATSVNLGFAQTSTMAKQTTASEDNTTNSETGVFENYLNRTVEKSAEQVLTSPQGPFDEDTNLASITEQAIINHIMLARAALDSGNITGALHEIITVMELEYEMQTASTASILGGHGDGMGNMTANNTGIPAMLDTGMDNETKQPSISMIQDSQGEIVIVEGSGFNLFGPLTVQFEAGEEGTEKEIHITADSTGSFQRTFVAPEIISGEPATVTVIYGPQGQALEQSIELN